MISHAADFKAIVRAAAFTIAAGSIALSCMPAQAQELSLDQFSLQLPGGAAPEENTFGTSRSGQSGQDFGWRCLSNREVRWGLTDYGFRRVEIVRNLRRERVAVEGQWGNWLYSMRVDKCTGEVDRVEAVRPVRRRGDDFGFGMGFSADE